MMSFCAATTNDGCLRRHLGGHLPAFHGSSLRLLTMFRHETGFCFKLCADGRCCAILCVTSGPPTLHCVHVAILDLKQPSGSRIWRGTMTSDDPAPTSPSVFQSSRAALQQDATKSPELVPRLSRSARSHEVAGVDTRLEPAGRNFDPILQHCTRHFVGFIGDLEEASPVCFWENVVAQVDPLFVVKKTGSTSMHEPAVFGTPFGPMLSV